MRSFRVSGLIGHRSGWHAMQRQKVYIRVAIQRVEKKTVNKMYSRNLTTPQVDLIASG